MRARVHVSWAWALVACSQATLVVDTAGEDAGEDAGEATGADAWRPGNLDGGQPSPGADATVNPPSPPVPGPHSARHRWSARLAAADLACTAVTGIVFYWLAFVAG